MSFHSGTSKIMSRDQRKANIMPQRGTDCMSTEKNEAPAHVQASDCNIF